MFVGEVSHSGQVRTTLNSSWRKACRTVLAPGHAVLGSKPPATGTWGGEWHQGFAPQAGHIVAQRTLGIKRVREYRSRVPVEAAADYESDRGRPAGEHVY